MIVLRQTAAGMYRDDDGRVWGAFTTFGVARCELCKGETNQGYSTTRPRPAQSLPLPHVVVCDRCVYLEGK